MEIGTLNQRIAFLEHSTKIDGIGNHKARWEEAFSCWAAVSVKTSTETTEAGVTQEVVSLEFTVRQTPDTKRMRAVWNSGLRLQRETTGTARMAWKPDIPDLHAFSVSTALWSGMKKIMNGKLVKNNVEISCKEPEH